MIKYIFYSLGLFTLLVGLNACLVTTGERFTGLPPGQWRATLELFKHKEDIDFDELSLSDFDNMELHNVEPGKLPFNFEVVYENEDDFYINIINGEERIKVDDINMGWSNHLGKDTLTINFPLYDSYIKGIYVENIIQGEWVVNSKVNYRLPFVAKFGKQHRFTTLRKTPTTDLSGKWQVMFSDSDGEYPAIGEFEQKDNYITGTFLTETGDYRFLEGTVQDNHLYLSCFDGSHAFMFDATIKENGELVGAFRSGKHYFAQWTATKNDNATLTNPKDLTKLKEGFETIDFSFVNTKGQLVSSTDSAFEGKAKIVQIMGTWCPNCKDETHFLTDYLAKNQPQDLAIVSLAFERSKDTSTVLNLLTTYKEKMNITYPLLWAGSSKKSEAGLALPALTEIISYPTMIFLNKDNTVHSIHTGFAGPATSEYEAFTQDFEKTIEAITQ